MLYRIRKRRMECWPQPWDTVIPDQVRGDLNQILFVATHYCREGYQVQIKRMDETATPKSNIYLSPWRVAQYVVSIFSYPTPHQPQNLKQFVIDQHPDDLYQSYRDRAEYLLHEYCKTRYLNPNGYYIAVTDFMLKDTGVYQWPQ